MTTIEPKNNTNQQTVQGEKETYIMVWVEETETFHFFKEDFNKEQYPDGYVAYYIEVLNGIIVSDTFGRGEKGDLFSDHYTEDTWAS